MNIYIVKIEDIDYFVLNELSLYFYQSVRNLFNRKKIKQDKIRYLIGKMILNVCLCKKLNIQNYELLVTKNTYGKPYILNSNDLYFNLSHSGEYVILGINNVPIGIDIEKIIDFDYIPIVVNNFSDIEKLWMAKSEAKESLKNFYKIWTLKESYIKAIGKGLYIPLKSFAINMKKNNEISVIDNKNKNKFVFKTMDINESYQISVCSQYGINDANIINLSQEKVIKLYKKLINMHL